MRWIYLSISRFQRLHRWSLSMDKQFHHTLYNACDYFSMPWLKLIHVSKSSPWVLAWLTPVVSRSLNIDFIYFNIYLLGHLSLTLFVYSFLSSCKASPLTMRKFQVRTVMQSTQSYFGEGFEQFISANMRLIHEHSYNISCKNTHRFAVFFLYFYWGCIIS